MTDIDTDDRLECIKKYGTNAYSALLLYKEMRTFPLASVEGFIGYRNSGGMLLVMGEPVCAPEHYRAAMQEFINYCRLKKMSFLQVCCGETYKEAVKDLGLSTFRIGENSIFDVSSYLPKGRQAKPARWARTRAKRAGVSVKEYDPRRQPDPDLEAALAALTRRWMEKAARFTPHLIDLNVSRTGPANAIFMPRWRERRLQ